LIGIQFRLEISVWYLFLKKFHFLPKVFQVPFRKKLLTSLTT